MKMIGQGTLNTPAPEAARFLGEPTGRLPVSLKILLENVLRFESGASYTTGDAHAIAAPAWICEC